MPTIDERLRHVSLKMKRTKEHVAALEWELRAFLESNPYKVGAKHDPKTRKLVYYVTAVESVPDCLSLIAGDAPPNPNWIYFPIADDAAKYEAKKHGKMKGASQKTFDVIDTLKPYKGGNDLLWTLYRLNNIEKHRMLLTVGSQAAGVNLGQDMSRGFRKAFPDKAFTPLNCFFMPADKGFPLKPGFELFIGAVDEKAD